MKNLATLLEQEADIATRYRIISLVRRRPFVNLYFASDFQQAASQGQSRIVAIRDIDLTSLSDSAHISAAKYAQLEYDLLRRGDIPNVLPAIDLRYSQGHLYLVSSPPPEEAPGETSGDVDARLTTLQDYLQSGQGLPSEKCALQLMWQLCQAVDGLHQRQLVIGDLDPFAILYTGAASDPGAARLSLLISWLPPALRELMPSSTTPPLSYFSAPEAAQGHASGQSDVYSLGAILYLLLTGMPPGESILRSRGRQAVLRAPQAANGRVSAHVSECVMQALAIQPAERFESAAAFASALRDSRYRRPPANVERDPSGEQASGVETVRIIPLSLKDVDRWRAAHRRSAQSPVRQPEQASAHQDIPQPIAQHPIPPHPVTPRPPLLREDAGLEDAEPVENDWKVSRRSPPALSDLPDVPVMPAAPPSAAIPETPPVSVDASPLEETVQEESRVDSGQEQDEQLAPLALPPEQPLLPPSQAGSGAPGWKQRITAILPSISTGQGQPGRAPKAGAVQPAPGQGTWFEQLKQVLLGQQQRLITAAAIVETPLRVLPNQMYTLRIHIMGRNEPGQAARKRAEGQEMGLSGLSHGDTVLIEVRSVLQQSYAYIVQRASVTTPAEGYVAEVTIPMQPLSTAPTGRRDRLHIFFLNEHRHPLYEKPFAVEIFVSHHVKRGNEGHHVLTIPL
jgi:serine/threonine protein kinase